MLALKQIIILGLFIFAGAYSLGKWHQSKGGGRVLCEPAQIPPGHVCIQTVLDEWKNEVLWIDARSERDWEQKSVPGSICLDPLTTEEQWQHLAFDPKGPQGMKKVFEAVAEGKKIVIFCHSQSCDASERLAALLENPKEYNIEGEIYVLHGGWNAIQRYPFKKF